jgi:type IV pilus assembly protein PilO
MADLKNFDLNDLDFSNIGAWPTPVKGGLIVVVCIIVLVLGYFLDISNKREDLARAESREVSLKSEFEGKQAKAANLDAYKKQMEEIEESFGTMLRQLPSKTEVENLVDEISQTGLASGVEFILFKPQAEQFIEFYAEKPITIKVSGNYHEFGRFVSGIAALPRIVTLHNIKIEKDDKTNQLVMDATAKTYRYLDENELAEQRAKKAKEKKKRRR